jgi:hypothetical protein
VISYSSYAFKSPLPLLLCDCHTCSSARVPRTPWLWNSTLSWIDVGSLLAHCPILVLKAPTAWLHCQPQHSTYQSPLCSPVALNLLRGLPSLLSSHSMFSWSAAPLFPPLHHSDSPFKTQHRRGSVTSWQETWYVTVPRPQVVMVQDRAGWSLDSG